MDKSRIPPAKSVHVRRNTVCGTRGIDQRRGTCFPLSPGSDEGREIVKVIVVERGAGRRVAGRGIEVGNEAAGEGRLTVHGRGALGLKQRLRHRTEHIHLHPPCDPLTKPPKYPLWLKCPRNSAQHPRSIIFFFLLSRPSPTMSRTRLLTRSFTTKCLEKPIMNRHSRVVTQPKDQGASQV